MCGNNIHLLMRFLIKYKKDLPSSLAMLVYLKVLLIISVKVLLKASSLVDGCADNIDLKSIDNKDLVYNTKEDILNPYFFAYADDALIKNK